MKGLLAAGVSGVFTAEMTIDDVLLAIDQELTV